MDVDKRKIEEIKPYPNNTKSHPESQIKKIALSIQEFGFNQPVVVDKNDVIIVGHGRYMAAKYLGCDEIPVLKLDLNEEQAKAYRLADNKLNESKWEMDIVIDELKSLSLEMVDLTGFDRDLLIETTEDKPDLSITRETKSKLGDLYELGEHKLVCGDSTKQEAYKILLGEEKARLIYTDPPWSVNYGESNKKILNDNKTPAEALEFYKNILERIYHFSTKNATIYWWCAIMMMDINMEAFRNTGWHFSQVVLWIKDNFVYSQSQLFHRCFEPCMVGWKKDGEPHYQDMTFSKFSELWTLNKRKFKDYLDMWYQKRDDTQKYLHPTQKPVQLAERALKRSSEEGDIVLDAFGGSGSTLIACEQLKRKARVIELDPKYCDVIVSRYLKYKEELEVVKNGEKILW